MSKKLALSIVEKLGVTPLELVKYKYNLKNDRALVEEIADILNVNFNPVKQIHELSDDPGTVYVWQTTMTDEQIPEFTANVRSEFVRKYNRDPQALHFIRNDITDIEELTPEEIKSRVEPFLHQE